MGVKYSRDQILKHAKGLGMAGATDAVLNMSDRDYKNFTNQLNEYKRVELAKPDGPAWTKKDTSQGKAASAYHKTDEGKVHVAQAREEKAKREERIDKNSDAAKEARRKANEWIAKEDVQAAVKRMDTSASSAGQGATNEYFQAAATIRSKAGLSRQTNIPDSGSKRDQKINFTVATKDLSDEQIQQIINNSPYKGHDKKYIQNADPNYDYKKYVDDHKDLTDAWNDILANPNGVQARYWIARMGGTVSKDAFGKAHAGESKALLTVADGGTGNYGGDTDCVKGTSCYDNLKSRVAKKCSGGKVWDESKGKCVKSTKNCADQGKEECGGNCVDPCTGNTEREEGGCGCVEKCGDNQVKCGGNCVNKCPEGEIMQSDCSCKPKEEKKSCANDSPNKPCGTWPDCKVCDEDEVPEPTGSEFGDEWDPWSLEGIEKPTGVAAEMTAMPQLAAVEKKGDLSDSEIVEKRMANLLTGDFAEKAKYEAKTSLAARGLFNTALAESAGLSAVMEHAFQIASMDATHYYGADLEDVRAVNDFAKTTYTTEATTYTAALNRAHEARQRGFQRQWDAREQRANRKWQSYEKTLDRGFEERMKKLDYDISRINLKSACVLNAKTSFASSESELFQGWGKEELSEEIYQEAVKKLQDQLDSLILSCESYDNPVKKTKFIA